jgi:ATP-binding cassette subfamily C protein CydCD
LQRLALARALLTRADIVLLDEPTAALDPVTEAVVVASIERLAREGATVIAVAHRPALVEIADLIVRVERPAAAEVVAGPADGARAAEAIRGTGW